jgi:hypothetical protein
LLLLLLLLQLGRQLAAASGRPRDPVPATVCSAAVAGGISSKHTESGGVYMRCCCLLHSHQGCSGGYSSNSVGAC